MSNYSIPFVSTNINPTSATSLPYVTNPVRIRPFPIPSYVYGNWQGCDFYCVNWRPVTCVYPNGTQTSLADCRLYFGFHDNRRSCSPGEGNCPLEGAYD